jgi:hypothetical protein
MKLWTIYFTYGDHEMESEIIAHGDDPRPSTECARKYLLKTFGEDYMDEPERLKIESVEPFTTVHDEDGNPFAVAVKL